MSAGGRLKTLACDQTAIFGPEFVFDRATACACGGGQRIIDLASGAQVRSDVVILNVGVEYRRLGAAGVDELLGGRRILRRRRQRSAGHARTAAARQIDPFCTPELAATESSASAHSGGYLKPSLSTPRLTRTSAALTCSLTAFMQ